MLHPLIAARLEDAIGDFRGPYGLLVVPLLLERGGLRKRVARVLVVDCPEEEQIGACSSRSGLAGRRSARDHGDATAARRAARARPTT